MEKRISHLAVILDGNGRWAKKQNKSRQFGHDIGFNKIQDICKDVIDKNIKHLTLYCFSTENWNRPKEEVNFLFNKLSSMKNDFKSNAIKNKLKIKWLGRKDRIDKKLANDFEEIELATKNYEPKLNLNLCVDYGSINEIKYAISEIFKVYENKKEFEENFDEQDIFKYLYTAKSPNIDLLIRPGKEKRLSNFMLLQSAYAELYFCDWYWPEYNKQKLEDAILEYNNRNRRFGKINDEK